MFFHTPRQRSRMWMVARFVLHHVDYLSIFDCVATNVHNYVPAVPHPIVIILDVDSLPFLESWSCLSKQCSVLAIIVVRVCV